jgi:hypothetical protein
MDEMERMDLESTAECVVLRILSRGGLERRSVERERSDALTPRWTELDLMDWFRAGFCLAGSKCLLIGF